MLIFTYLGSTNTTSSQRIIHDASFSQSLYTTHNLWILINIAFVFLLLTPLIIILLDYLDYRRLQHEERVFLELTPPAISEKSAHANKELFAVLHGLYSIGSFKDRTLRHKQAISLEVVSSREEGIRFIACVPKHSVSAFRQTVVSYLPHVQFKETKDYLDRQQISGSHESLMEFKLWRHFARPLQPHDELSQHDPISFITGSMAKPEPGELLALQFVLTPADPREVRRVHNKLLLGKDPKLIEFSWRLPFQLLLRLFVLQLRILSATLEAIGEIFYSDSYRPHERNERTSTKAAQAIDDKMLGKLQQAQFRTGMRAYIVMKDRQQVQQRVNGLVGSLASFQDPGYQALRVRRNMILSRFKRWEEYRKHKFTQRLPSMLTTNFCMLSAEEVANLFHFPYGQIAQAENTVKSFSKTLAAPVAIKRHADNEDFDVMLGLNRHHGMDTPIGLTAEERQRHLYIIGGTGNGKTTMLQYQIIQDMQNGKGVAIVDPHGDMAETLLQHVPPERVNDVIYFNPDDMEYPIGLNLLELTPGLTGNDLLREKDIITESVISVFRKIFSEEDSGGHRIEYVLRNTIQTALTIESPTLFTVFDLLNDPKYRKGITKTLEDKNLINFWKNELGKAGDMQKVKMAAGITAKIGRFLFSASAKQILEQPKSTIDFDDIINSGKILICNFSKGLLGEDTSELFGITVLAKLQLASLRRARLQQQERRAFYLYVDEFQNFATTSFVQMLSEARKYKLFLAMAEQSTSQQKDQQMVNIILANVGTVICFRTGNPQDERMLLPLFSPYIEEGEISNLSAFNFYAKLSAVHAQEPLSGQTLLLKDDGSSQVAEDAIEHSRATFTRRQPIEEEVLKPATRTSKEREAHTKAVVANKNTKMLDLD